jgi:hypothetical protein
VLERMSSRFCPFVPPSSPSRLRAPRVRVGKEKGHGRGWERDGREEVDVQASMLFWATATP